MESSNSVMEPSFPLPLQVDCLKEITRKAKDWALMHGIGMRPRKDIQGDSLVVAPFVLFPSVFPRREFYKAKTAQIALNQVIHKAAHNYDFLKECLTKTIQVDTFTASLFEIFETVRKEGVAQFLSLGLIRCDYFLDIIKAPAVKSDPSMQPVEEMLSAENELRLKQVEYNTIAAGFGWMGPRINRLHRYVMEELGANEVEKHIPENLALRGLSEGIVTAWKLYGVPKAIILFIVEPLTVNICDQRMLEFDIRKLDKSIIVIRKTFAEIDAQSTLKNGILSVDGMEVAVAYFRTGYGPDDYSYERAWDVRLKIERSRAIKCPSIHYHLAGTKKIQQELARPGVLEMFLSSAEEIALVRELFTGIYALDLNEEGDKMVEKAIDDPSKYVLKPQREGGGNNFYNDDVRKVLVKLQHSEERTAFILMDRIQPPPARNYVIKPGSPPEMMEVVSELGIFGVIIGSDTEIMMNEEIGHLLRTKQSVVNEGGVSAGFAALDSVYLI